MKQCRRNGKRLSVKLTSKPDDYSTVLKTIKVFLSKTVYSGGRGRRNLPQNGLPIMASGYKGERKMECKDILNLIAIVVIPIAAVLIGQHLQNRAEIRKDKMQIFKTLMTSRIYGWTQESVHCLNIIDIVFADDKTVRDAWKDLYDKYCVVENPDAAQLKKIQNAQYKLLETISKSLGYKDKVTWETIQKPICSSRND